MSIEQTYRRFKISASVSPLPANRGLATVQVLSLIHISEPTRR